MACITAGLSFGGISALGGMLTGGGLANFGGIVSGALGGVSPIASSLTSISSVAAAVGGDTLGSLANPLVEFTSGANGIIQSVGSAAGLGSGAFTGVVGSGFGSLLTGNSFVSDLASHAGDLFGSGPLQMAQTFGVAEAFASLSQDIAGPLTEALGSNFGANISALTKVLPIDGDFGNFLGATIPDLQSAVTNGLSVLTGEIGSEFLPDLAGDLVNLGSAFNLQDVVNFGNPGQLINAIYSVGGENITGIADVLEKVGLDPTQVANLAGEQFNGILNEALSEIVDPRLIANAQKLLGSNLPGLESLADFSNLQKALPVSFDNIKFDNFAQFAEQLANTELGTLANPLELGNVLNAIQIPDLPGLSAVTDVIDPAAAQQIINGFLGGTGENGSITVSDIMGTVGGIGIKAANNAFQSAVSELDNLGKFNIINTIYSELETGIAGGYLDDPDPALATKITDPRSGLDFTDLDAFLGEKVSQVESELSSLVSDAAVSGAVGLAKSSYTAMQSKVFDEKTFANKTDLQLSLRNNLAENAYHFTTAAVERASNPEKASLIEGMAEASTLNGNKYGEYWTAYMAENRNKDILEPYGVRWRFDYSGEA